MDIGSTIKSLRKNKGLTQEGFATSCGISQNYLSQIENNLKEPNLSTLSKIAETLGIPISVLMFLSTSEDDVAPEKREFFNEINTHIKQLVHENLGI